MSSKIIKIEPVTRLEGLAKIVVLLDEKGKVKDAFFQVVELRGFERFVRGRPIEEVLRITPRICGVCPIPHHLAPAKAADKIYAVEPPKTAKMLREILSLAHIIHSHILHFYAFALPDFALGEKKEAGTHNILGLYRKYPEVTKKAIKARGYAQKIQMMIGAKATHPVTVIPGGVSKGVTKEEAEEIHGMAKELIEFGKLGLQLFEDIVLKDKGLNVLLNSDTYKLNTHYMSVVGPENELDFYESNTVRIVDNTGKEIAKFEASEYLNYIAEHVEPWSYVKFPYLKQKKWLGLVDGPESGMYRVNALARLNVVEKIKTPLANEAMENMFELLGGKPAHHTLGFNWARLVEILYAAERIKELTEDDDVYSKDYRVPINKASITGEGVGVIEAPRGTLYHHYKTDSDGLVTYANIIVATTNNNPAICLSVKKAAEGLINQGVYNEDVLNKIEMAFRAYDPCLACATHSMPGQMPLTVKIYDSNKKLIHTIRRKL